MSIKGKIYLLTLNNIPCRHESFINNIKTIYLRRVFKYIGKCVNVRPRIKFANGNNISIGDNSGIGEKSFIQDIGSVEIGRNVLMGPEVMIFTSNHGIAFGKLIIEQDLTIQNVKIEDDVWIGARAIILPGVIISKGTVIAAGTIVTKDTEEYSIVAGNPGKIIKYRQ